MTTVPANSDQHDIDIVIRRRMTCSLKKLLGFDKGVRVKKHGTWIYEKFADDPFERSKSRGFRRHDGSSRIHESGHGGDAVALARARRRQDACDNPRIRANLEERAWLEAPKGVGENSAPYAVGRGAKRRAVKPYIPASVHAYALGKVLARFCWKGMHMLCIISRAGSPIIPASLRFVVRADGLSFATRFAIVRERHEIRATTRDSAPRSSA